MWTQDSDIDLKIGALGANACEELFDAYGVRLSTVKKSWGESDERLLSGSMGFVGRHLRGTCLLATTERALSDSCPAQGKLRDWIGELTNQLVGRLKTKLLGYGVEVFVTTPIVLSGVLVLALAANAAAQPAAPANSDALASKELIEAALKLTRSEAEKYDITGSWTSTVHLWTVPAPVEGAWSGNMDGGRGGPFRLELKQRYQHVEGRLVRDAQIMTLRDTRIEGTRIRFTAPGPDGRLETYTGIVRDGMIVGETRIGAGPAGTRWSASRVR